MAQIIVAKWPRKHNKAIESSNRLLFAVVSTVIGWINFIKGSIMVILGHKCLLFIPNNKCNMPIKNFCKSYPINPFNLHF